MQYFVVNDRLWTARGREAVSIPKSPGAKSSRASLRRVTRTSASFMKIADVAVDDITSENSGGGSTSRNRGHRGRSASQPLRSCPAICASTSRVREPRLLRTGPRNRASLPVLVHLLVVGPHTLTAIGHLSLPWSPVGRRCRLKWTCRFRSGRTSWSCPVVGDELGWQNLPPDHRRGTRAAWRPALCIMRRSRTAPNAAASAILVSSSWPFLSDDRS